MLCYLTHLDQKEKKKRSKVGLIYLNVCSMLNSQKYTPISLSQYENHKKE